MEREMSKQTAKLEKMVADFNKRHSVGSVVQYHRIIGEGVGDPTKTRSEAWILSGHSAVVMVEGVSGCMPIDAVSNV
jgi:hypothetical protein